MSPDSDKGEIIMRRRARGITWATLALGIGTIVASGLLRAAEPAGVPPTGLPENAPPFGLPDSAPPFGKGNGNGKGKGRAVAGVSYHCLGVAKQIQNQGSPYSYLADSIVLDAGGQGVTLEGAATGDLVVNDETTVPTHMAGASITTDGLTLQPFDTCGTSAGSVLNSVVAGVDQTDSSTVGAAYVEFRFNYHAKLEFQNTGNSEGDFSAFTETTLHVLGLEQESFRVRADGKLIEAPPGLAVTDLSVGDHFLYEIAGTHIVEGQLFYGPGITNIVQTTFQASGEVSGLDIEGSRIVAGFASAEALNTLTYEIVSLDPNVSFSFVPAEASGDEAAEVVSP
jgi:hypothetical protein